MVHGIEKDAVKGHAHFFTQFALLAKRAGRNMWRNQVGARGGGEGGLIHACMRVCLPAWYVCSSDCPVTCACHPTPSHCIPCLRRRPPSPRDLLWLYPAGD